MAKAKNVVKYREHPKQAPDGMEFVDVKRTVGENVGAVIRCLVPKANGEGYSAGVKYLNSMDVIGVDFASEAFRSAWIDSVVAQGKEVEVGKVGTIVPRVAALRVVDKAQVYGQRQFEFVKEHGRIPTAEENKELYAGLAL